jgi:hypothetical protein
MTGGIMPKLFAVRWPLGIVAVLLLTAGMIALVPWLSSRAASDTAIVEDYTGERQQLLFFKAALGRIDEELRHRPTAATPSLRGEREAVLRRMREVASRVPADRLPADIAVLLRPASGAPVAQPAARQAERAAPRMEIRKFQTGLGTKQVDIDFSSLTLDPPPPLPIYIEHRVRRAERSHEGEPGEKAERPARERPAKAKERVAAEKPTKDHPPADRPPVTVERTAVLDNAERRQSQPAR